MRAFEGDFDSFLYLVVGCCRTNQHSPAPLPSSLHIVNVVSLIKILRFLIFHKNILMQTDGHSKYSYP